MYQVTFSIGAGYVNWFYAAERKLKKALEGRAVMVTRGEPKRLFVAVACENNLKREISEALCETLLDIFSVEAKRDYFVENLKMPLLSEEKYNILLTALVEFDASSDRELIKQSLNLESGLNIDGVYNFAFSEIKARWKDIGNLTKENALYLTDNEIFFELIKYMFSAITPKAETAKLHFDGQKYTISDIKRGELIGEAFSDEELLCALIRVAPISLEFSGERLEEGLKQKLNAIFGTPMESRAGFLS
ncbi:MAG: hypothetical protein FWE84_01940 [Firmicutes bacterium]|nr:hypothetical protein [Bacillota bacterium]